MSTNINTLHQITSKIKVERTPREKPKHVTIFCRRKILSPRFSPPVQRKGGVDESTASFMEPMRPSTSHGSAMATIQQKQPHGSEDEDNESEDEVSDH